MASINLDEIFRSEISLASGFEQLMWKPCSDANWLALVRNPPIAKDDLESFLYLLFVTAPDKDLRIGSAQLLADYYRNERDPGFELFVLEKLDYYRNPELRFRRLSCLAALGKVSRIEDEYCDDIDIDLELFLKISREFFAGHKPNLELNMDIMPILQEERSQVFLSKKFDEIRLHTHPVEDWEMLVQRCFFDYPTGQRYENFTRLLEETQRRFGPRDQCCLPIMEAATYFLRKRSAESDATNSLQWLSFHGMEETARYAEKVYLQSEAEVIQSIDTNSLEEARQNLRDRAKEACDNNRTRLAQFIQYYLDDFENWSKSVLEHFRPIKNMGKWMDIYWFNPQTLPDDSAVFNQAMSLIEFDFPMSDQKQFYTWVESTLRKKIPLYDQEYFQWVIKGDYENRTIDAHTSFKLPDDHSGLRTLALQTGKEETIKFQNCKLNFHATISSKRENVLTLRYKCSGTVPYPSSDQFNYFLGDPQYALSTFKRAIQYFHCLFQWTIQDCINFPVYCKFPEPSEVQETAQALTETDSSNECINEEEKEELAKKISNEEIEATIQALMSRLPYSDIKIPFDKIIGFYIAQGIDLAMQISETDSFEQKTALCEFVRTHGVRVKIGMFQVAREGFPGNSNILTILEEAYRGVDLWQSQRTESGWWRLHDVTQEVLRKMQIQEAEERKRREEENHKRQAEELRLRNEKEKQQLKQFCITTGMVLVVVTIGWLIVSHLPQDLDELMKDANALAAEKQYEIAFPKFVEAANRGNVEAQFRLGWWYEKGLGTESNLTEARNWYQRAAEGENTDAMVQLGRLLKLDYPPDSAKIESLYFKAAKRGNAAGQYEYAILLKSKGDYESAFEWAVKAAEQGYSNSKALAESLQAFRNEIPKVEGDGTFPDSSESPASPSSGSSSSIETEHSPVDNSGNEDPGFEDSYAH